MTVMHVLLYVYILRACEGNDNAGVGSGVGVGAYIGGTRGSGVLYSACDVLEMSVVYVECAICACLARSCERIGFGLFQSLMKVGYVCVLVVVVWVGGLGQGLGGWCGVCILCVDGRSRYRYIVLSGYLPILDAPSVKSCCTLSLSAS